MIGNILVTKHAIEQLKKRIIKDVNLNDSLANQKVIKLFKRAKYVGDNQNGILFRNSNKRVEFIVKQGKIITLFPIKLRSLK